MCRVSRASLPTPTEDISYNFAILNSVGPAMRERHTMKSTTLPG